MARPLHNQTDLGATLRNARERGGFGAIDKFCADLGVGKTALAAYERGEKLPEVDFLATFAERTGADFQELLRLRLASGKTAEARKLAQTQVEGVPAQTQAALPPPPAVATKALNDGEIDGELLVTIVARMERALLCSDAMRRAVFRALSASADDLQEFSEALAKGPDALLAGSKVLPGLGGVVQKIAGPLAEFAAVEAGLAARIYNKVVRVTDPAERDALIDGEVRFYILLRSQLLREAS